MTMKNPLRTKLPVSDHSEDSDESDDSESNISEEEDQAGPSAVNNNSESDHEKQDNSEDSESEDDSESESDSDSESNDENKNEEFDHKWEEHHNEAPDTDAVTRRIAVCNMDWDRIRAVDLLMCFNSFKPADGIINSVKIYPSEFGLKRMEEENLRGPYELVEETLPAGQEEIEDKKSSKYHTEKLRQYQINRMKYYYAVIDCDSPETANSIYEQMDGMEYESSSVRFDLRFIPGDMTFDHEPKSVAEKVPPDYKPRMFVTSALQQVKVNLTWDETDPDRKNFFDKVFTDPDSVEDDIKNYLASDISESEEEDCIDHDDDDNNNIKIKDRISKYKELLKSIEEKEKKEKEDKIDVECTWKPALKEESEAQVKDKIKKDSSNSFEETISKKKEQKEMKKKNLKKQNQDEDSENNSEESSEEEEEDNKNIKTKERITKYKELLKSIEEKEKNENDEKIDAEYTWDPALKEETEAKVKDRIKKVSSNPFEEMLLKKKEKKKMKKKDLKKQNQNEDSENDSEEPSEILPNEKSEKNKKLAELALISDYKIQTESEATSSLKKKKKKVKSDDLDGFVADMNDPRFSAIHTSSLFNMVPSEHINKKKDGHFGLKRPKGEKFKSRGFQKNKKAKYN